MKFFYDPDLLIPQVKKSEDASSETKATHNHSPTLSITNYKSYKPADRAQLRSIINGQVREVKNCIQFFEKYKNIAGLTAEEKAEINASIRIDKNYIDDLQEIKPGKCTIL